VWSRRLRGAADGCAAAVCRSPCAGRPRYLRAASLILKAPISGRQTQYLQCVGSTPESGWSWVHASVEIHVALGHAAGGMAITWLREQGVPDGVAWKAGDRACQDAGRSNPHAEPAPETPPHVTLEWDTAMALDTARAQRGGRDLLIAARPADMLWPQTRAEASRKAPDSRNCHQPQRVPKGILSEPGSTVP
jgi:hypothetical protein